MTSIVPMSDSTPSLDDAARQRAIMTEGSVLVQAPAGSGKTTLLAQRYLHLLAMVETPEQILALTFTRRAAQEMRDRVIHALRAARQTQCPPDFHKQTWELALAAQRHMDDLQINLEHNPARLRIETIDSFNAWLARQLPISAGSGSGLHMADEVKSLYEEAARRALAHEADDRFGAAVDRVLALSDQRWHRMLKLIAAMLPSRDRWLPLLAGDLHAASILDDSQLGRVRQHFDEDLALLVSRALGRAYDAIGREKMATLSQQMRAAAQRLLETDAADLTPGLLQWHQPPIDLRADTTDLARWRSVVALLLSAKGEYRKRLTKAQGFPPQCADKSVMLDLMTELERDPMILVALAEIRDLPMPAYTDEQWARVRDVAQVLVLAAAQLTEVFREAGGVDFPAVSLAALRALGSASAPSDLSLRLDYRLQHILVDEFQDTSGAQLDLLRLLTAGWQRGDGRSLFCVGDPMQSIYGFRQAEVRAFLELAEEGIGDLRFEVERLSSNFRSSKSLVDWINACFSQVMPLVDNRERGAIAFRLSESVGEKGGSVYPAVRIEGFATRGDEAFAIAAMIAQRVDLQAGRIVVLVRAKSHAREIAAALRERGIAFRAVDIEPLHDRAVVRDLVMLTRALVHLGDRTAWFAVLRAPWVGLSLSDLLVLARAAPIVCDALANDVTLAALSESGRARCQWLRQVLESAQRTRHHSTLARWVESTWLSLGGATLASGPDDLEHVRVAFSRLRVLEQYGLPDAADLAQSFEGLFASNMAPAAVEIMTIHKAKGLEFDTVILPALDRYTAHNGDPLLLSHQFARSLRDGMVMAARPPLGAEKDLLFEFLRRQARDSASLEADRLLYVACTRAKSQLILTATLREATEIDGALEPLDMPAWKPRAGSLLAVLWRFFSAEFMASELIAAARIAPSSGSRTHDAKRAPRGGVLYRVPVDFRPEVAAAAAAATPLSSNLSRAEIPIFDWAGETARRVGSLVHAELQAMQLDRSDEPSIRAREPQFRHWLALQGVPADRLSEASMRVMSALLAVQADARGRWILKPDHREAVREHALSGIWRGEVVRVVFDRSFIDEQGVRWVIDYKTSQHTGSGLDAFLDREVERYQPQMQRYAALAQKMGPQPVRLGLYFPLMRAWREWQP